jgi:hypothetical protein
MRLLTLLLTIVFTVACADESHPFRDAGDGTGGSAGAPRRGDGAAGAGGALAVNGAACSGPDECASGACVDGVCCATACAGGPCRSCSTGVCLDEPDGRRCGASTCDGVKPYAGQNGRLASNHVCRTGACVAVDQDCRAAFCTDGARGCPAGAGVCTNVSEDQDAPTACACLQNPTPIDQCPAVRR